jgi:hypothetical protein
VSLPKASLSGERVRTYHLTKSIVRDATNDPACRQAADVEAAGARRSIKRHFILPWQLPLIHQHRHSCRRRRHEIRYLTFAIAQTIAGPSLHEHHLAACHIGSCREPINIDTACQAIGIEAHLVASRRFPFIDQHGDFSPEQIVYH